MSLKKMAKGKLGDGSRFAAVAKSAGGGEKGRKIAAVAGFKAHGKSKMMEMAAAGKKRKSK